MYRKPELTDLSVYGTIIQQNQKFLLPSKGQKKYQQLKAQAFKLKPPKLKEQGEKEEAHLESDLHQEYAYSLEKQQKQQKQQLLKQKEERHEVLYRHRAKAKVPAKGGACCTLLLALHLLGNKKASHPGEETIIKEVKK